MATEKYLLSILALNVKGQLNRMTSAISENNLNILRMVLSAADLDDKIHRTIAYVEGTKEDMENWKQETEQIENVLMAYYFQTGDDYIEKELCLIKILTTDPTVHWVMNSVSELEGRVISTKNGVTIFQIEGSEERVSDFINQLTSFTENVEICRSGMVATSVNKDIIDLKKLSDVMKKIESGE